MKAGISLSLLLALSCSAVAQGTKSHCSARQAGLKKLIQF